MPGGSLGNRNGPAGQGEEAVSSAGPGCFDGCGDIGRKQVGERFLRLLQPFTELGISNTLSQPLPALGGEIIESPSCHTERMGQRSGHLLIDVVL